VKRVVSAATLFAWSRRVATAAALYGLIITTPAGGAIQLAAARALGLRTHDRAIVAYFDTVERRNAVRVDGLDAQWAEALLIVARRDAAGREDDEALLRAAAAAKRRLGSEEAAAAALIVGSDAVADAIRRARGARVGRPTTAASFGAYLPSVQRGPVRRFVANVRTMRTALGLTAPINGAITSGFGFRRHPILKRRRMHTGVDISAPTGTPIHAAGKGRVVVVKEDAVNGKFLRLDHGDGVTTAYCHASKLLVARGRQVDAGAVIAKVGATGRATGPHLHFQIEVDGRPVDPRPLIEARAGARASVLVSN